MSDAMPTPGAAARWLRTPAAKVCTILILLLCMQIPLMMVGGLINEREGRQNEVLAAFRRGWGPEQAVAGPTLMVPYSWKGDGSQMRKHAWAQLPAARLNVSATLIPEERRRGLFHAIVYAAAVELSGTIVIPPLAIPDIPDAVIEWEGARVVLGASDLRGMPTDAAVDWNGSAARLQASEQSGCGLVWLEAPAGLHAAPAGGTVVPFKATLSLRGTQAFRIVPAARQTDMRITSSWPTPAFTGATFPLGYELRPNGFDAQWSMAGDAATWQLAPGCGPLPSATWTQVDDQVGVTLQEAVPTYVMVDRAAKYGVFFLALAYLTLFLFETLSGQRIHIVQYGLVGLSLSLFALLLISIAEPLGFTIAYAISAVAVMAQASLYMLSVVDRRILAAVFAAVLGALFTFLYVVLSLDAYALLSGTIGLFAALSVVMATTRSVNWAAAQIGVGSPD